jgi:hypothetical protein
MVYDHKNKTVFIHIPKNAGTSVEKMLCRKTNKFVNLCFEHLENKNMLINKYIIKIYFNCEYFRIYVKLIFTILSFIMNDKYQYINKHGYLNHTPFSLITAPEDFKVFAIIRNPYDRVVSIFGHSQLNISFDEFCIYIQNEFKKKESNENYYLSIFLYPQVFFIMNNLKLIDKNIKLLRYENIENDWIDFVNFNQLPYNTRLPKFNTNILNKKFNISKKSKEIINLIYREDFEKLGYEITI